MEEEKQEKELQCPPSYAAEAQSTHIKPQHRKLHDAGVSFEEYHYYALKTRELEKQRDPDEYSQKSSIKELLLHRKAASRRPSAVADVNLADPAKRFEITDEEWSDASRALRTATWGACFYLITTDILGPYGVGFAMGTLGWGPGIVLYTVFGFMAGYSGYLLWKCFLGLDSFQYPCKNYGDLAFRLFGQVARQFVNILQALLLLLILGQVIILFGQSISQLSKFRLCYAVCCVVFVVVGFFIGQVRTLRNYGWLANTAVFLNLLVIFISMGVMAHTPPNYSISILGSAGGATDPTTITPDSQDNYPPIIHFNGLPNPSSLIGSINGLMQGVFAYGGAQLFIEFMAEMRRPYDFIKAMWGAQFFIYSVYLIYGCYQYYWQGQYSFNPSYIGLSRYGWQAVCDSLASIAGLIAAGLYGNIGIKVFYNNVLMDIFKAPPLTTKTGKTLWVIIVPIWWSIAFVIAAAIPDYFGFVSIIAAIAVIQFSYSFPPIIALGYNIHYSALKSDPNNGFDPVTGHVTRNLTGIQKWIKGFWLGPWWENIAHVIYAGGALATAGLGMYVAIEAMIEAFKIPQFNSFSCKSPLDLSS